MQVGTLNYMSPEAILGGTNNIRGAPPMKVYDLSSPSALALSIACQPLTCWPLPAQHYFSPGLRSYGFKIQRGKCTQFCKASLVGCRVLLRFAWLGMVEVRSERTLGAAS